MTTVRLERLSIAMEEGRLTSWLVADGDLVVAGQVIAEVETDKATAEIEAPDPGRITIVAQAGDIVPVEGELARIEAPDAAETPGRQGTQGAPAAARAAVGAPAHAAEALSPPAPDGATVGRGSRPAASPAARRRAQFHGIALTALSGTGPRGRIVVNDVEAALAAREAQPTPVAPPEAASSPPGAEPQPMASRAGSTLAPAEAPRDLRAAVVAGVTASWKTIPHIHIGGQLEAGGLVAAKARVRGRPGPRITATDLLVVAVVQALRDVPELNGSVGDGGVPRRADEVHLALAVATDRGVVAPVLRRASGLSVEGVAHERERLVGAARSHSLDPRDLAGATCTLSNLGGLPVDFFAPVVTSPQIALIATGRVQEQPIVRGGLLGVGHRMWVNAAIDHRGADGEAGGRFLQALEERLAALELAL